MDCRVKPGNDHGGIHVASLPENRAIMAESERDRRMIAKLLLQNLIWTVVMGALLFVPAGTLHWPVAWVFLGTIAILGISFGLWLPRNHPAPLAQRTHPLMHKGQPGRRQKILLALRVVGL